LIEEKYGRHSNADLLRMLDLDPNSVPELENVATLRGQYKGFPTYADILETYSSSITEDLLQEAKNKVHTHDICNLQYTSGSTGHPKAAMLTHQ
jgi:long-subunit acyl-CoA synthetase (AMP-forming)